VFSAGFKVVVPEEPVGNIGCPTMASMVSVPELSRVAPVKFDAAPPLGTPFWQIPETQIASRGQSEFCEHVATLGFEHAASAVAAAIASNSDLIIRSSKRLRVKRTRSSCDVPATDRLE
jgi:hypothetical protein